MNEDDSVTTIEEAVHGVEKQRTEVERVVVCEEAEATGCMRAVERIEILYFFARGLD